MTESNPESNGKNIKRMATMPFGGEAYRRAKERGETDSGAALKAAFEFLCPALSDLREEQRTGKPVDMLTMAGAGAVDVAVNLFALSPFLTWEPGFAVLNGVSAKVLLYLLYKNVKFIWPKLTAKK